jgi:hypothetical protein
MFKKLLVILVVTSLLLTGYGGSSTTTKVETEKKLEYTDYKLIAGKPFAGQP